MSTSTTQRQTRRAFDCLNDSGVWADVAHHIHDEYGPNMRLTTTDDPRIVEATASDGATFRVASTGGRAFRLCDMHAVDGCSEAMTRYVSNRKVDDPRWGGWRYVDYMCDHHAEATA